LKVWPFFVSPSLGFEFVLVYFHKIYGNKGSNLFFTVLAIPNRLLTWATHLCPQFTAGIIFESDMKHYKTARANHTNAAQLKNTIPQQHGRDLPDFLQLQQKTQTAIYFFITQ